MAQDKDRIVEMDYVDPFGDTIRVRPKINMYANNNNLYVGLDWYDKDYGCWEPYCDVTVNIWKLPYLESAIDTNNNDSRILKFLVDQGFGQLTDRVQPSGFCVFPVFRFNADKLEEIDPVMFNEYEKVAGEKGRKHKPLDVSIREAKQKNNAAYERESGTREVSSGRDDRE